MAEKDRYEAPAEGDARASRAMVLKSGDLPSRYRHQESDHAGAPTRIRALICSRSCAS